MTEEILVNSEYIMPSDNAMDVDQETEILSINEKKNNKDVVGH